jgi:hypothetical protein
VNCREEIKKNGNDAIISKIVRTDQSEPAQLSALSSREATTGPVLIPVPGPPIKKRTAPHLHAFGMIASALSKKENPVRAVQRFSTCGQKFPCFSVGET